jgi:hypothetical protein
MPNLQYSDDCWHHCCGVDLAVCAWCCVAVLSQEGRQNNDSPSDIQSTRKEIHAPINDSNVHFHKSTNDKTRTMTSNKRKFKLVEDDDSTTEPLPDNDDASNSRSKKHAAASTTTKSSSSTTATTSATTATRSTLVKFVKIGKDTVPAFGFGTLSLGVLYPKAEDRPTEAQSIGNKKKKSRLFSSNAIASHYSWTFGCWLSIL